MCYRTRKYTVCRHVHASFSPEILQAGAVKALRQTQKSNLRSDHAWPLTSVVLHVVDRHVGGHKLRHLLFLVHALPQQLLLRVLCRLNVGDLGPESSEHSGENAQTTKKERAPLNRVAEGFSCTHLHIHAHTHTQSSLPPY